MPSKKRPRSPAPETIVMPMDQEPPNKRQRRSDDHNPRTNPAMHDGNSAHGNPNETAVDELTTDNDTGDV
jgi:hypothetical protein